MPDDKILMWLSGFFFGFGIRQIMAAFWERKLRRQLREKT